MPKLSFFILALVWLVQLCTTSLFAADLDDISGQLVDTKNYLYEGKTYYYKSAERGIHGLASFDTFDASPYILSFENFLTFSILKNLEVSAGLEEAFHSRYKRLTYNASSLVSVQNYRIDYSRKYGLQIRFRKKQVEAFLDISGNRHKGKWDYAPYPADTNFFTYILSHYEHFNGGIRYMSKDYDNTPQTNLSALTHPLMNQDQFFVEIGLGYKKGNLKRNTSYYTDIDYYYTYYHDLTYHLNPQLKFRYGFMKNMEFEAGIIYTTPFKYRYEYTLYYPTYLSDIITGTYKLENNFSIPAGFRYRPLNNLEISVSSPINIIKQRLDYWKKNTDNTTTTYPSKELIWFNATPSLAVTYLIDSEKQMTTDTFSAKTKNLLIKGQWLIKCRFESDITYLHKNSANETQNIIDPYNVFLYPTDYFVFGSEYAALFTGNLSRYATNVNPQNYYTVQIGLIHGLSDFFNIGTTAGYRSGSSLHHFTLHDRARRCLKFKPYYFIDSLCDLKLTKNSLITFKSHVVPYYESFLDREGAPKQYRARNTYFELSLSLKILF